MSAETLNINGELHDISTISISSSDSVVHDIEEGECTIDEEHIEGTKTLVFTLNFEQDNDFDQLSDKIVNALKPVLPMEQYTFKILNGDHEKPIISVYRIQHLDADVPDLDESELFKVDTAPTYALETDKVPSYKRTIRDVLDEDAPERKKQKNEENDCPRPKNQVSCFNCGDTTHSMRACPKPRNEARIKRALKRHSSKHERYHKDVEQRFAHLKPGQLSSATRNALNLQRGELPSFFYRMRVYGYPPAWLEDAKVQHSGIVLFNADGSEVLKSDEENGVADKGVNVKYDISKIIDFPGFNMRPGNKYYDDFQHHNVPPMANHQMKSEFIKSLGDNIVKGYKRKKLKNLPSAHDTEIADTTHLSVDDMEIVDDDAVEASTIEFTRPPLPVDPPPPMPDAPLLPLSPMRVPTTPPSTAVTSVKSPTLADLQAQQEQLLEQLKSNVPLSAADLDNEMSIIDLSENSIEDNATAVDVDTESQANESNMASTPASPTTPASQSTPLLKTTTEYFKESHLGTPLLKFSPYDKLPSDDKFKVGVSDVINFENLPDSTGKYEQMKVVIQNIRKTITKLQDEDV